MKREDLQNQRFGKLTVIGYAYTNERNRAVWLCECDCGKKKEVTTGNLKSGSTRSCGCLHKEQPLKEWAEELGVNYYTLHSRIVKRGWSVERALTKGAVMYG